MNLQLIVHLLNVRANVEYYILTAFFSFKNTILFLENTSEL